MDKLTKSEVINTAKNFAEKFVTEHNGNWQVTQEKWTAFKKSIINRDPLYRSHYGSIVNSPMFREVGNWLYEQCNPELVEA